MKDYIRQNKDAWEFNTYDFWVEHAGTPEERAKKDMADPVGMLKKYAAYFDSCEGVRVANICGSCGKKAIPLALLGAKVTLFDICQPLDASTKFVDSLTTLALLVSAAYCFGKEFLRSRKQ